MQLEHIKLLQIQRDLHDRPRGMARFGEYLRVMRGDGEELALPPLVAMNPMGREHVTARLDELLALDADAVAEQAIQKAVGHFAHIADHFKHGLVIADDVRGGWTNRYTSDAALRFNSGKATKGYALKQHWITTVLWASETPSIVTIRQEVLTSVYRSIYIQQHGPAKTLQAMMEQEGRAARFAGMTPQLDAEDLAYSREVLQPYLAAESYPLCFAAMYGDPAARLLGYTPLGLSERAGFAVALADRQRIADQHDSGASFT